MRPQSQSLEQKHIDAPYRPCATSLYSAGVCAPDESPVTCPTAPCGSRIAHILLYRNAPLLKAIVPYPALGGSEHTHRGLGPCATSPRVACTDGAHTDSEGRGNGESTISTRPTSASSHIPSANGDAGALPGYMTVAPQRFLSNQHQHDLSIGGLVVKLAVAILRRTVSASPEFDSRPMHFAAVEALGQECGVVFAGSRWWAMLAPPTIS